MTAVLLGVTDRTGVRATGVDRYTVADGTQVNVDGTVLEGGATVELDQSTAQLWLRAGWLVAPAEASAEPPVQQKRRAETKIVRPTD